MGCIKLNILDQEYPSCLQVVKPENTLYTKPEPSQIIGVIYIFNEDKKGGLRYAYCVNNPLKYYDADGEVFWVPVLAMAAAWGGSINLMMADMNGNIDSFGDALVSFGVGAFAGAAGAATGAGIAAAFGGSLGLIPGAVVGAISTYVSASTAGMGNAWLNGSSLFEGYKNGILEGADAAWKSAIVGGAFGGTRALIKGRNVLNGEPVLGDKLDILEERYSQELNEEIGDAGVDGVHVGSSKNFKSTVTPREIKMERFMFLLKTNMHGDCVKEFLMEKPRFHIVYKTSFCKINKHKIMQVR